MSAKSKSFTADFEGNPAMRFITQPQERPQSPTEPAEEQQHIPGGEQTEPPQSEYNRTTQRIVYLEKRTQRVQLVMQPSVLDRARAAADKERLSLNEYIHRAIIEKLDREGK